VNDTSQSNRWAELRIQAEQRLLSQSPLDHPSEEDMILSREQQLHRVELEIQHERLLETQQALAEAHQRVAEQQQRIEAQAAALAQLQHDLHAERQQRREAEERSQRTERFKQGIIDALSSHIAVLDETSTIITVNEAWRVFGEQAQVFDSSISQGANYLAICDAATGECSEGAAEFAAGLRTVLAGEQAYFSLEYPCHSPEREYWFVGHVTCFAIDGQSYTVVAHEDVTARHQAAEALRESEEKFRCFFEQSGDGLVLSDERGHVIGWSHGAEVIYGLHRAEVVRRPIWDVLYQFVPDEQKSPATQAMLKASVEQYLHTGHAPWSGQWIEREAQLPDGTRSIVQSLTFPIHTEHGALLGSITRDITELKEAEQAMHRSLHFLETLLDTIPAPVFYKDVTGRYLGCNRQFAEQIMNRPKNEIIGRTRQELLAQMPGELADIYRVNDDMLLREPGIQTFEAPVYCADGQRHEIFHSKATFLDIDDSVAGIIGVMLDITERKQTENALRAYEVRMRAVLNRVPIILFALDPDGVVTMCEGRGIEPLGMDPQDIVGQSLFETFGHFSSLVTDVRRAQDGQEVYRVDTIDELYFEYTLLPMHAPDGSLREIIGVAMDISERMHYQHEIERLAFTDPLTGLANRRRFYDLGTMGISLPSSTSIPSMALLYLDLDRFKMVNDTMGHDAGDELLVQVAERLNGSIRKGDTLARIGGDEFAVLLPQTTIEEATGVAQRMLEQFEAPFSLRGQSIFIGGSIGITTSADHAQPFSALLTQADIAMYRAKAQGIGLQIYHPALEQAREQAS
jgi:diguanylate cyclase (GGDEF)-like protein/PAS domain S-box-containing protein